MTLSAPAPALTAKLRAATSARRAPTAVADSAPPNPRAAATAPGGVVLPLTGSWQDRLPGALRTAAEAGCPLHLVVPAPRPMAAWALLPGAGGGVFVERTTGSAVSTVRARAAAAGVHLEVHPATGRLARVAAEIARTVGGVVSR